MGAHWSPAFGTQFQHQLGLLLAQGGDERPILKDVYPSERRAAKAPKTMEIHGPGNSDTKLQAQEMIEKWKNAYPQALGRSQSGKAAQTAPSDLCQNVRTAEMGDLTVRTYRGRPRHLFDLSKRPPPRPVSWSKRSGQKTPKLRKEDRQRFAAYASASRQANNSPVQGGSADLVAEAMVKAEMDSELKKLGYVMVLQVHDELIFEGPEENAQQAQLAVKRVMEEPFLDDYKFLVPLVVDVKAGDACARIAITGRQVMLAACGWGSN
eukprot:Skav201197  [mRNA]  locus=scaffold633:408596:417623:- [translate_table: standard]